MAKCLQSLVIPVMIVCFIGNSYGCKSSDWYNMTMEQLLLKSDIVLYGKDIDHGKFRMPMYLDARFDVYCVLKNADYLVPGQVIIENIDDNDKCSGVYRQTQEGQEYIVGLKREFSGFMSYADVNPLQKTAFPATAENLNKVATFCGLDEWTPPETGDQNMCPTPAKPRFCTKIRYPDEMNSAERLSVSLMEIFLFLVLVCLTTLEL